MNDVDAGLVARAQSGDERALDELLRAIMPLVRNVCRKTLNNADDADDATQVALINVVRSLGRFDGRSSFTTWVYRVATNAALDEGRRRQRRGLRAVDAEHESVDPSSSVPHDRIADADELTPLLRHIPEEFRVALVLRDVMDLDYDRIAEILDVPGGTVRSRIARGRARLAELLGNQSPAPERHNPDQ